MKNQPKPQGYEGDGGKVTATEKRPKIAKHIFVLVSSAW